MPYILRDDKGKIYRASARQLHGSETVSYSDPDLIAFLEGHGQKQAAIDEALDGLRKTDADMVRAIEDVITTLMKKNLLKMTDLPKQVQEKMALRVSLRVMIQDAYDSASDQKSNEDSNNRALSQPVDY